MAAGAAVHWLRPGWGKRDAGPVAERRDATGGTLCQHSGAWQGSRSTVAATRGGDVPLSCKLGLGVNHRRC